MTDNPIEDTGNEVVDDTTAMPPEINADTPEAAPEGDGTTDANAEAKSWRLKYRSAATRADIAEARVSQQNRRHVEQVLAKRLADPADAFANGLELDNVLDDDGLVDEDAVLDYANDLVSRKPHYAAKLQPIGAPASSVKSADPIPTPGSGIEWHDLLGGKSG
jgi:hypothetical protein